MADPRWPPQLTPCNAQGRTALICVAARYDEADIIEGDSYVARLLIGEGKADVDAKDDNVSAPRVVRG